MILDLLQHNFEQARELYGDRWLGFPEGELQKWLEAAGFKKIEVTVVAREDQSDEMTLPGVAEMNKIASQRLGRNAQWTGVMGMAVVC